VNSTLERKKGKFENLWSISFSFSLFGFFTVSFLIFSLEVRFGCGSRKWQTKGGKGKAEKEKEKTECWLFVPPAF
jgi:hypothetical protein